MVRKSTRVPEQMKASSHKRGLSTAAAPTEAAKRTKALKVTPTKSQYFESQREAPGGFDHDESIEESSAADEGSDFGEVAGQSDSDEDEAEDQDESYDSADDYPRKQTKSSTRAKGSGSTSRQKPVSSGKTGLGPGTQLIMKKPKARPAGFTPYMGNTIHPNTLLFLKDLKANNRREWLKLNDADFRVSEKDFYSFVEALTERLLETDDTIPELPVKDVVRLLDKSQRRREGRLMARQIFRIYRDVRFSPDPTPYKPHFSAAWSRTGRKGPYAHYYVQVSPSESFVGGGLWHPDAHPTALMREVIDVQSDRIKRVLLDADIRREFLKGAPKQEGKVVKAFVDSNAENALKTKPRGFDSNHKELDLLRLRNYTLGRRLPDQELLGPDGLARVVELFRALKPFITLLNSIVMPDPEDAGNESEADTNGNDDSN